MDCNLKYRGFIVQLARSITERETTEFRYFSNGKVPVGELEDKGFVEIVQSLERADELSSSKLDFLADFLQVIRNEMLLKKLHEFEAEMKIEALEKYSVMTRDDSERSLVNVGINDVVETAEILMAFLSSYVNLPWFQRRLVDKSDKCVMQGVQGLLGTSSSLVLLKYCNERDNELSLEELVSILVFYGELVKLESSSPLAPLRECLSRLIADFGGWNKFVNCVKQLVPSCPSSEEEYSNLKENIEHLTHHIRSVTPVKCQ